MSIGSDLLCVTVRSLSPELTNCFR